MAFSQPLGAVSPLLMVAGCPAAVATPTELVARDTALLKSRFKSPKDMSGDEIASAERDSGIIGSKRKRLGRRTRGNEKQRRADDQNYCVVEVLGAAK